MPVYVKESCVTPQSLADVIGQPSDRKNVGRAIESYPVLKAQPLLSKYLFGNGTKTSIISLELMAGTRR